MTTTIYFDCFAGISGDMFIGALLDLGLDLTALHRELQKLPLDGYRLEAAPVNKNGVQATQFKVMLTTAHGEQLADSEFEEVPPPHHHHHHHHDDPPHHHHHNHDHDEHRALSDILALIEHSALSERVKATASRIFTRLGQAEAKVHGLPLERVHFHEVGGVDAIVDIVGAAIGLELLGVEKIYASALHLGTGFVRCAHGLYPVPAPATANLIAETPVYTTEAKGELVTPTGAAIITTLAEQFGPMPMMVSTATGYGAGSRDREFPNVLRAHLGRLVSPAAPSPGRNRAPFPEQHGAPIGPAGYHDGPAVIIETSIDDMNPQHYENLVEQLLQAEALDVALIPVQMKKNRPGTMLHVLAHPRSVEALIELIFKESTSIGVRTYEVTKHMLQRETQTVNTPYGPVRVKLARLGDKVVNISPEYEDCRRLAREYQVPVKEIYHHVQVTGFTK